MQFLVYQVRLYQIQAIIQGIRSSGTTCAVVSLSSTVTIIRRMPSSTACAVVSLSDTGNRLRDALSRHRLYSLQSTEYGYNNHPRDAFFYCLCSCQSIRYGQLSKACTACAVFSQRPPSTVTIIRVVGRFFISLSNGLQLSKGCLLFLFFIFSFYAPLAQSAVYYSLAYQTTYNHQRMRFSFTEYAVVGLPAVGLSDSLQSFKGCVSQAAIVGLPVVSLSDGVQSSKGCVSPALSMQLSISRSSAYWMVHNHLRDAVLLH